MKYAKLIDGVIEFAPKNKGSILNYNTNEDLMLDDGYKPFIPMDRPETNRMYHIEYEENFDGVREVIVYDETQEEADERIAQQERKRINSLTMTKRVFALGLQELGITYEQLKELIATNDQAQLEWDLCVVLQRSNPLLDVMASQLEVTPTQLDLMFRKANGEDVKIDL